MELLCHRGLWGGPITQNSMAACVGAWAKGWGVETDIRDSVGQCVVSHDPPNGREWGLQALTSAHRPGTTLALNVKSDGLVALALPSLSAVDWEDIFVFDSSVPDQRAWVRAGVPTYTRQSDVEPEPVLYADAAGVWLDAFYSEWWDVAVVERHVSLGKRVAIVSPELHGRDYRPVWERLAEAGIDMLPGVSLCTDDPVAASRMFSIAAPNGTFT
jgi:hypothetical protein